MQDNIVIKRGSTLILEDNERLTPEVLEVMGDITGCSIITMPKGTMLGVIPPENECTIPK